ncbi:MAG: hypothetical protein HZA50_07000 [Planctomycetes bacterium]|nr:hypothetical protein [Planctomycetota bacterium]
MKNVALMLAVVAVLGLVVGTVVVAQDAPKTDPPKADQPKPLVGKVAKAADDKGVLEVTPFKRVKEGEKVENVKVATDDKTVVTLDGKEAKLADLKEGLFVKVTPAEGTATKIEATTEAPKRPGRPGGDKPRGDAPAKPAE